MLDPYQPFKTNIEQIRQLASVVLGKTDADLAIVGGEVLNVYTGEILANHSVLVKGDRIAYIGQNGDRSIGTSTQIIDAAGKVLVPGFIDGHTHIDSMFSVDELVKYAMQGGTTTVITEINHLGPTLGYEAILKFIQIIKKQRLKY